MPVSQEELEGVLRLCDPAQTGLVSLDYFTQLASLHCSNQDEAQRLVQRLDARGRGYLSYQEFCHGVSTILCPSDRGCYRRTPGLPENSVLRNPIYTRNGILKFALDIFSSTSNFVREIFGHYWSFASRRSTANTFEAVNRIYSSVSSSVHVIALHLSKVLPQYTEWILRFARKGGKERMMAPSVGQRNINANESNDYISDKVDSNGKSNSRCSSMSDGESYECYGEVDMDTSLSGHLNGSGETRLSNGNSLKRNTWLRTSLKRSSNNHENLPNRRWGSFRQSGKRLGPGSLGSPLNRSSSFNSSGRSSACDTGDDVYSDASLEEDVLDLNHKVQMLQQQMSVLADNQTHSDERYTRAKQDNATLQARVLMLEEQLREVETRSEEKLAEQERRHKELVARVDREKQLQVENCAIRLQTLELENSTLREEASRCKAASDRLRVEAARLEDQLNENEILITSLREEIANLREQERKSRETLQANQQVIEELSDEIERLRNEQRRTLAELDSRAPGICPSDHENLQSQFLALKEENSRLQEAHDEMQALLLTRSVEEGRSLLTGHQSLAAELEAMSQDEASSSVSLKELPDTLIEIPVRQKIPFKELSIKTDIIKTQVRLALKEQQEVNAQLRAYIDGILLNIVDNYPQLLEVKPAPP